MPNTEGEVKDFAKIMLAMLRIASLMLDLFIPIKRVLGPEWTCYMKGTLPVGKSDLHQQYLLNQMNWGLIPVDVLWPLVSTQPDFSILLPDHCREFEYEQLLWIAKHDPPGIRMLLQDRACARAIDWYQLNHDDYRRYFSSLAVYDIYNIEPLDMATIRYGLDQVDYLFPSPAVLGNFLKKLLSWLCDHNIYTLSSDIFSIDLVDMNAILMLHEQRELYHFQMDVILDFFLLKYPETLLMSPHDGQYLEALVAFVIKLAELDDFANLYPTILKNHTRYVSLAAQLKSNFALPANWVDYAHFWERKERFLISIALLERDALFFVENFDLVMDYYTAHHPGPFDQKRLLQILLSNQDVRSSYAFLDFYEKGFISESLLIDSLTSNRAFKEKLVQLEASSSKLMKTLCLIPYHHSSGTVKPVEVVEITCKTDFWALIKALNSIKVSQDLFKLPSFSISHPDQPVIDLGGPLLDWICRLIQGMAEHGLFSPSLAAGNKFAPRPFLPLQWFHVLGLLHGKLLQLNSQPQWTVEFPTFHRCLGSFTALLKDPEAVALFNEVGFRKVVIKSDLSLPPRLIGNYALDRCIQVTSATEAKEYFTALSDLYDVWLNLAQSNYRFGVDCFVHADVTNDRLERLLATTMSFSRPVRRRICKLRFSPSIPHDDYNKLTAAWNVMFNSLSDQEVSQFLLFATGQSGLMFNSLSIDIEFIPVSTRRLPTAKTCTQEVFFHVLEGSFDDWKAMKSSLLYSIQNYQGFGHA